MLIILYMHIVPALQEALDQKQSLQLVGRVAARPDVPSPLLCARLLVLFIGKPVSSILVQMCSDVEGAH